MEAFSASVISSSLLVRRIRIMVDEAWRLVSPPEITQTLCQYSLELNYMECIFLLGG